MRRTALLAAVLVVVPISGTPAQAASGSTFKVTRNYACVGMPAAPDSQPGTLGWALSQANAQPGPDRIEFVGLTTVDLSPCWRPNLPVPYGLQATESVEIIGNGVTIEGNQYFLDPNGQVNNPLICPGTPGSPPTNWIAYSTGFLRVGTFKADNSAVAVTVRGMNFHNVSSLFKLEKNASLSLSDSRAWQIDSFTDGCDRAVIETAAEGANVTLSRVQVDHSHAPGARTGEYDIAAVVVGGYAGKLVLSEVTFGENHQGRAVSWLGGSVQVVSSKFLNSGGMYLSGANAQIVNSALYTTGTLPSDRMAVVGGQVDIAASTFYWAWGNASCRTCTTPEAMGFVAGNARVSFTTSAVGASNIMGGEGVLLYGSPGTYASDALTWVQPTAKAVSPMAVRDMLPNALVDPPGLTTQAWPWVTYESVITPMLGTAATPGVLMDAVADAQAGGSNQLRNPIDGSVITKDIFGNPRVDANDARDIGAVQLTLAPRLSVVGTDTNSVQLGWSRPSDPTSGAITGYAVFYRVKGSGSSYRRVDVPGATTLTTSVAGLRPDTAYDFYVVGVNATGDGPRSNVVTARTRPQAPIPSPEPILSHLDYPPGVGLVGSPLAPLTPLATPPGVYRYRITAGALPAGLSIDAGTGVISGTPTKSGVRSLTVQASGPNGSASAKVTITIHATAQPPHLGYPVGRAVVGSAIDELVPNTAFLPGPIAFALTSGALPPGLTLDPSTGIIAGTPSTPGMFQATITATGSDGQSANAPVTIVVASPAHLLTISLQPTAHSAKLKLTVLSACPSQFSFRLQKRATRTANGGSDEPTTATAWVTLPKTYRTKGSGHSLVVNQGRGTYRALVGGACLFSDTQSAEATLKK